MSNFSIAYLIELKDKYTAVAKRVAEANDKIRETIGSLDTKLSGFSTNLGTLKDKFGKVRQAGTEAFVGWSIPVGLAIGGVVKLGAELEDTRIGMTTMLGSAEKANKLVADIRKMGAETPFESKDLLRNAKMLLNFGIAEKDVIKNMSMLGDVSGGNIERFNSLTYAFSQMSSQGKLMGGDLMQMVNAGFNPLQTISKKTGKSMGELREMMSKGGITAKMVTGALVAETSKGGRFYQYMAKNASTFNGLMSTLSDTIGMVASDIGEKMLPTLKPLVTNLIGITSILGKLSPTTLLWIIGLAGLSALLPVIMVTVGFLGQAFISFQMTIAMLSKAFLFLNATMLASPIFWIVVGVVALIAILVLLYKHSASFRNVIDFIGLAFTALVNVVKLGIQAIQMWAMNNREAISKVIEFIQAFIKNLIIVIGWILKIGIFLLALTNPITAIIALVVALGAKFNWVGSIVKTVGAMLNKFNSDANVTINKQEKQIQENNVSNKNKIDFSGRMKVEAEKGTNVIQQSFSLSNSALGKNRAYVGAKK